MVIIVNQSDLSGHLVLCWGSSTGWDITRDGKIACCRINYDDYVNFEIEIFSPEQVEEYKATMESNATVKPSIEERLETLEQLNSKGMLSAEEYVNTRALILSEVQVFKFLQGNKTLHW